MRSSEGTLADKIIDVTTPKTLRKIEPSVVAVPSFACQCGGAGLQMETMNKLNEKLMAKTKEIQALKSSIAAQKKETEHKIKELEKSNTKLQLDNQSLQS